MMTDAVVEVIAARRVIELQPQKDVLLEIVTSGPQGPRGDSGAKASLSDHPDKALSVTAEGTLFAPYLEYSTIDW